MDTSHSRWIDRPLAVAFLRFNLQVADLQHPSRDAPWREGEDPEVRSGAAGALVPEIRSRLARHTSLEMLGGLDPKQAVVPDFNDPALPVFMASEACFERLIVACGLVVLGPGIRRIITRDELQALRAELSREELAFARGRASELVHHIERPGVMVSLGRVRLQATELGQQVLYIATSQATPPVACRARLRLPADLRHESLQDPLSQLEAASALGLARSALHEVDPEWLSLFPVCH